MDSLIARVQVAPRIRARFAHAGAILEAAPADPISSVDTPLNVLAGEHLRAGDLILQPLRVAMPTHRFDGTGTVA